MKLIFVGLSSFFFISGCSHTPKNEISLPFKILDSRTYKTKYFTKSSDYKFEGSFHNGQQFIIFDDSFSDFELARNHFLNRRLMLQRNFQSHIEPYFGLVDKTDCVGLANLTGDIVKDKADNESFFLDFPVDLQLNPWDCGKGNAPLMAHYEFHSCKKSDKVIEARIYSTVSQTRPRTFVFSCPSD